MSKIHPTTFHMALFLFSFLISSCSSTLYDEQSDLLLTKYAQESNMGFLKLERAFRDTGKVPAIDNIFYDSLRANLAVIHIRMSAMQQGEKSNRLLDQQFDQIEFLIDDTQKLHTTAFYAEKSPKDFTPVNFSVARQLINSYLRTLIAHESVLKVGSTDMDKT